MMWSMCQVAVIVWDRPLLQGLLDDVVYVSGSRDRLGQAFITRLAG